MRNVSRSDKKDLLGWKKFVVWALQLLFTAGILTQVLEALLGVNGIVRMQWKDE